jgi:ribA/ribD-fused uncharacterized protein
MYNNPKYRIDWREISIHDDNNIKGFFSEFRFLSNFEPVKIEFEGRIYPSTENAYQAAKIMDFQRDYFVSCSSSNAKSKWKTFIPKYSAAKWDEIKLDIMEKVSIEKYKNPELKQKLLGTGDKYLEESNFWQDVFWGVDYKLGGRNELGKLLMKIREGIKNEKI